MISQKSFENLNMAGDLLRRSPHRFVRPHTRRKAFQVREPEIFFDQLIATMRLSPVWKLLPAHGRYIHERYTRMSHSQATRRDSLTIKKCNLEHLGPFSLTSTTFTILTSTIRLKLRGIDDRISTCHSSVFLMDCRLYNRRYFLKRWCT